MEFLKPIRILLMMGFILGGAAVYAQTQKELQEAFSKSYAFEADKKYAEAISALTSLSSENRYEINLRLGWLYYLSLKYDQSIAYYLKCTTLMPVATEPLWAVLNPYLAKEDWVNVEKTYLSILKQDPKNTTANYKLGLIYYYRKNYTAAKKYFDVTLNLFPFDYDSLLMSAWTHYFLGNMKDAKVLFNKVLLYAPNDKSALEGLSLIK